MSATDAAHPMTDLDALLELPNLANPATRTRLTPAAVGAVVRLAAVWHLGNAEICALLGDRSDRTWFRIKSGEWSGTLSQDVLTRVGALLGIFNGLRLLFSKPLCDGVGAATEQGPAL
jgi:hypothetical protein